MSQHAVTLKDVATRAGVSKSTASRVLNSKPICVPVTTQTRMRILAAARELGYRPNRLARGLITAKTDIVGVYQPLLGERIDADGSIPRWLRMGFAALGAQMAGIQSVLSRKGYDLHVYHGLAALGEESTGEMAWPDLLDGLLLPVPSRENLEVLKRLRVRIVTMSYYPPELAREYDVSGVYLDGAAEVYRVVRGWAEAGHTRIGIILFADLSTPDGKNQLAGYTAALADAGLRFDETLVATGSREQDYGFAAARRVLDQHNPPTALFVGRADNALDVLRGVKAAGKRCPEDVELVVWCEDHAFEATDPPLAALDVPFYSIGKSAATLLCDEIEGGHRFSQRPLVSKFLARGSARLRRLAIPAALPQAFSSFP